jgi:hypothetical protein
MTIRSNECSTTWHGQHLGKGVLHDCSVLHTLHTHANTGFHGMACVKKMLSFHMGSWNAQAGSTTLH